MRIAGWSVEDSSARLAVLPALAVAGCVMWLLLPQVSDAESHSVTPSGTTALTQDAPRDDAPAAGRTVFVDAPLDIGAPETVAAAKSPLDGLKISAQSWRRGGLGSKALVTFTLRNANDYAVKDVEIACAFARRDGSHLTDRRRVIADTLNMKSRKRYAGMLVGFVNVNANKAKCSLVAASRI
jgi:hypothetical protein